MLLITAHVLVSNPKRRVRIPDPLDGRANDVRNVDVGLGGDLTDHTREPGRHQRLTRDPGHRVVRDDGVQDGVGDLVRELVGVSFGHGL